MAPDGYVFRAMSVEDLPTVRRWLAVPHVRQWWGDPEKQFGLVSEDMDHPSMQQFIVAASGRPFAYLQCYDPAAWPDNGFGTQPDGARGIDQFIGEPDMVGRGHGSALIRAFVADVLQRGAPRVITDPDPQNARAIRAYKKAGFREDRLVDTPDGRAMLMVCGK
jgi:aminoglycoside 6'-N-acetyltransferase